MKAAVRLGALVGLWGLIACASGAPASKPRDRDAGMFVLPAGSGGSGGGGSGGGGSGGSGGAGSGGSGGAGSGGSRTDPPIVIHDAAPPDSGPKDSGPPDSGPMYSCDDGKKNGMETSADCGGDDCDPCDDGKSCVTDDDCMSMNCSSAFSCTTPSCTDKMLNQDETDIDCGGGCETKCKTGNKCKEGDDCETGSCDDTGHCACVPLTCKMDQCGSVPNGCGATMNCPDMCSMIGMQYGCNNQMRKCVCDPGRCSNNCQLTMPTRCCKADNTCGCENFALFPTPACDNR